MFAPCHGHVGWLAVARNISSSRANAFGRRGTLPGQAHSLRSVRIGRRTGVKKMPILAFVAVARRWVAAHGGQACRKWLSAFGAQRSAKESRCLQRAERGRVSVLHAEFGEDVLEVL